MEGSVLYNSKMFIKNKKADLATTFLVFMTLIVAGATIFLFLTSSRNIEAKIVDARFMDDLYLKEEQLDFYISEIIEKAFEKTKGNINQENFVNNFKIELGKYKKNGEYITEELGEIEKQADKINYDGENEIITAEFKFLLTAKKEPFTAVYIYNKKFVKEI